MPNAWAATLPKGISVLASDLVDLVGEGLIGQTVMTPQWGDYPGGKAVVTEVGHDVNAPEIVFLVKHPSFGEIGVFENEEVYLI